MLPDGETPGALQPSEVAPVDLPPAAPIPADAPDPTPDDLQLGVLLGILLGEGHFGGDGRQPQITLRMHTRHERLFRWLERTFPGGRLYGPYHHGGRSYFQWMLRGDYLRRQIVPLIAGRLDELDEYAALRFAEMCRAYRIETAQPSSNDPSI